MTRSIKLLKGKSIRCLYAHSPLLSSMACYIMPCYIVGHVPSWKVQAASTFYLRMGHFKHFIFDNTIQYY